MRGAYYNEHDKYAADWIRNLIAAGHIAPGDVDTRDIRDVRPDDLRGYTQCHFFAGIGVWSYALRLAGWPDDRPVWTGSCPCQPFSAAGAGLGFADERHLWPHWFHLIRELMPASVLGEQVASKDAGPWLDLVQDDMESLGHAFGAIPFPSAGVGAPHIRDRLYWLAHAYGQRSRRNARTVSGAQTALDRTRLEDGGCTDRPWAGRTNGRMADHDKHGRTAQAVAELHHAERDAQPCRSARGVDNAERQRFDTMWHRDYSGDDRQLAGAAVERSTGPGPTNSFWRDADWLLCRDGKWRPVEPGTFPLAHGAPARVGRLRAYGNAINAQAAAEFIRWVNEAIKETA
ncbi:methyltransferase [Pandoraea iniqua]|uniref:DNA cytosine methyltransferase n=1 Tax=Pandoraea iniqua TaxID=2508288 RepID=UPI0012416D07|nr:DNA cytosine methyltransferase [Pandoraea iniqua]VVE59548.1 methyltransferase [Pandoraea iniqua]